MSIATSLTALQTAKTDIATAITNKGGTVTSGDGFSDFATDIATIPSGNNGVATLVVTAPTGSTVTVTKDGTTLTATESSGTWTFVLTSLGTWTINASKGSQSKTDTVEVTSTGKTIGYATTLADMALGSTVQLLESSGYVEYEVVEKKTDAVVILRKTVLSDTRSISVPYQNGSLDAYVNETFIATFSASVQALFTSQNIKCLLLNGTVELYSRQAFIPSAYEFNGTTTSGVADGESVWNDYCSLSARYWLRTYKDSTSMRVGNADGSLGSATYSNYRGVRPAIFVINSAIVDTDDNNKILTA